VSVAELRSSLSRRHAVLSLGRVSVRFERRAAVVYLFLALAAVAATVVGIGIGDYPIGLGQIVDALRGAGDDRLATYFVTQVRLPRAVTALLVGAALGMSGAIFQTVSGNPLGSPDVIGFTTGAATGALVQIILFNGNTLAVALASSCTGCPGARAWPGSGWCSSASASARPWRRSTRCSW
jgi:iron complex transport system permease protein